MKALALCAALLFASTCFCQTQTITINELAPGTYSVNSSSGNQLVNVLPLGGGSYSFYSTDGSSTLMTLAPGMYTITSSAGANVGTTYINSLGSGMYSFSNPTTGTTGTIQSVPQTQPIPLPALAIQQPNNTNLYILAALVEQQRRAQCNASGGWIYKPHWYSKERCVTTAQLRAEREYQEHKKK